MQNKEGQEMPKTKRKPGAGRPRIDPEGAAIVQVRIPQDAWKRLVALVEEHQSDVSKEVRAAIRYWVRLLVKPERHVGALTVFISILIRRIEAATGKRWVDDPVTGAAVGKLVEQLILHFAPTPTEPVNVPPTVDQIAGQMISIAENLHPRPGVPGIDAALFGDEWAVLALLIKDLGSGWNRNKDVWLSQKESES
jgi:hypothetical protein